MVKYQEERQEEGSGKGHCCDKRMSHEHLGGSRGDNEERRGEVTDGGLRNIFFYEE